jgi:7,8-dihydropterin-6-yl-methyl-4-(beta-D-ribofuranosyl)aminobenzene 5'-phosphate synthase
MTLFSKPCNCPTPAPIRYDADIGRREVLCAGGAGFVSALVSMLIGRASASRAQPLTRMVPEVDRLAVRIVTDNYVFAFLPSQKRSDLVIERVGGNTAPDRPPRTALAGEFGLSMLAESQRGEAGRKVLIDFGYTPETLLNNMAILKIDPAELDALVLSHGHYDHFGGMIGFLDANKGRLKKNIPFFVGGEDCFCVRTAANGGQFGALDRRAIADASLTLMVATGPAIVADHGFTTGQIPLSSFEKPLLPTRMKAGVADGLGCFPDQLPADKNTGSFIPDDFQHEIGASYVVKGRGLVVLTSCSHRGVVNTVRQAQAASGIRKLHAVIGGMHLVHPLPETYIRETVAALKALEPDYVIPAHCSGDLFFDIARAEMPNKVVRSAVGSRFIFGT